MLRCRGHCGHFVGEVGTDHLKARDVRWHDALVCLQQGDDGHGEHATVTLALCLEEQEILGLELAVVGRGLGGAIAFNFFVLANL